jgi:hypothetical protein
LDLPKESLCARKKRYNTFYNTFVMRPSSTVSTSRETRSRRFDRCLRFLSDNDWFRARGLFLRDGERRGPEELDAAYVRHANDLFRRRHAARAEAMIVIFFQRTDRSASQQADRSRNLAALLRSVRRRTDRTAARST